MIHKTTLLWKNVKFLTPGDIVDVESSNGYASNVFLLTGHVKDLNTDFSNDDPFVEINEIEEWNKSVDNFVIANIGVQKRISLLYLGMFCFNKTHGDLLGDHPIFKCIELRHEFCGKLLVLDLYGETNLNVWVNGDPFIVGSLSSRQFVDEVEGERFVWRTGK